MPFTKEKLDQFSKEIRECIEAKGYYKTSSCNASNWDIDKHAMLLTLYHSQTDDLRINYEINWGVHDWMIVKVIK